MVRVTFLVTPFKIPMIERMARHFSSKIQHQLVTPTYPGIQGDWARLSKWQKLDAQLLGGQSMREQIRQFEPDVIYADNAIYASQFRIVSLLSNQAPPLILHLRGDWWREYWAWFASAPSRKRLLSIQQYAYNWAAIVLARKVAPTCKWLECVVRHYVPGKKSEVVYQGVEPDEFYQQGGFEFSKPAVAIIQNHSIYPKVAGLLQFRRVAEKLPAVHFYIAEGEQTGQQLLPTVKQHFANLKNVHFVPGVTNLESVRKMLTASDCYVLASGLDCCPSTVLEASLMQLPVVVSKVGGVPELVRENETGWTIENSDTDAWVEIIRTLANDRELAKKLGMQGRKWVSENFSWPRIAKQVERIITEEAESRS